MIFESKEKFLDFLRFENEHNFIVRRVTENHVQRYVKIPTDLAFVPDIPKKWQNDRNFIVKAVKLNGRALVKASEELQRDRELYLLAAGTGTHYRNMPPVPADVTAEADKEFLLNLLSVNGMLIFRIYDRGVKPDAVDMDLVRAAVSQNYEAASIFSYSAMCDRDFVKQLVNIHGRALVYAAHKFRDDEEIVYDAVLSYRAFELASNRLKNNEAFLMKVLDKNPSCIAYAPVNYREDRELMTKLIDVHPYVYRYVKGELQNDLSLARYALKRDVNVYEFIQGSLRKNEQVKETLQSIANDETKSEADREYAKKMLN